MKAEKLQRGWTREETILAFELYCWIPRGKDTVSNPQIQALAAAINRSANSIKLKLQNFKSLDTNYTANGRKGLAHASALDKAIAADFFGSGQKLVFETAELKHKFGLSADYAPVKTNAEKPRNNFLENDCREGADIMRSQKARIGQTFFRRALLAAYDGKCCITGISLKPLLRASHIKPWAQASADEKVNPANGLLLNALFDAALDQGYISLGSDYRLILSHKLLEDEKSAAAFAPYKGRNISPPSRFRPASEFIQYHNDCVFLK